MPSFDLDPGEVTVLVRGLLPRRELVYRIAILGLSARCRSDRQFRERTGELTTRFRGEMPTILTEAETLADELTAAARAR